jgi:hypothetical protein
MRWNHRIIKDVCQVTGETYLEIHEVYYNDNDIPNAATKNPITISGENLTSLIWTVDKIKECLGKPMLEWDEEKGIYIEVNN